MSDVVTPRGLYRQNELLDFRAPQYLGESGRVIHNGLWLNQHFQEIGRGDLSGFNCADLSLLIDRGEAIFVLREDAGVKLQSYFDLNRTYEPPAEIDGQSILDFIINNLALIISSDDFVLYLVASLDDYAGHDIEYYQKIDFTVINRAAARIIVEKYHQ